MKNERYYDKGELTLKLGNARRELRQKAWGKEARLENISVFSTFRNYSMVVPSFWLSYLSPELIRELSGDFRELPFSEFSDVFAFG